LTSTGARLDARRIVGARSGSAEGLARIDDDFAERVREPYVEPRGLRAENALRLVVESAQIAIGQRRRHGDRDQRRDRAAQLGVDGGHHRARPLGGRTFDRVAILRREYDGHDDREHEHRQHHADCKQDQVRANGHARRRDRASKA
jgi:hypothetical protein